LVGVRRNTPIEIVAKLNQEINAALADPKIKARFTELGGTDQSALMPADLTTLPPSQFPRR
jgi:tripartite-type tricarboxylate transporter receptor subunit TctC